jgi:hypothetical protein
MSEKIEPALAQADWQAPDYPRTDLAFVEEPMGYAHVDSGPHRIEIGTRNESGRLEKHWLVHPEDFAALIAVANAALPDDDPRKLTLAMVDELMGVADQADSEFGVDLFFIADALASYLPPREP